ncbi:SUMF1/EgtB/PvdO family nonheme iron enzyme [Oscillatoriales cyanobacterium LEGE 11467]|uniref:SUMF1/EgtB/PvdO family nonheme iron enzyme n=1 Tax=Zarconia navalis LEGE 11467 TaxID=1828826 RepID=A0A928VZH0_9CYAN|nr:formylglycine-generating enzyme family protein [Zarconia navalis]MBE9041161.1 SUMF1/EgtB/PvdO family nonheme iron enzyme [Zarconia navalis LEGE 11467]
MAKSIDLTPEALGKALLSERIENLSALDANLGIDSSYITCEEYQLFLDEERAVGKYYQPDSWTTEKYPAGEANQPVLGVRASDAEAFCEWLTQKYARWRVRFRLPTPAEAQAHPIPERHIGYWCKEGETVALTGIELDGARILPATLPLPRDFDHHLMRDRDLVRNLSTDCERLLSNSSHSSNGNALFTLLKVSVLVLSVLAILLSLGNYVNASGGTIFMRALAFLFLFVDSSPTEDVETPASSANGFDIYSSASENLADPVWGVSGELYILLGIGVILFFCFVVFKQLGKDLQNLVHAVYSPVARKLLVEKYYSLYPRLSEALKIDRDFDPTIYEILNFVMSRCQDRTSYHKAATHLDELLRARDFWNALADFLLSISGPSKIWWFRESNRKRLKQIGHQCSIESQEIYSLYSFIVLTNKRRLGYASAVEGIRIVREKLEYL